MKVLITGVTGFIGSRLALHARREGWQVVATGMTNTSVESGRVAELRAADIALAIGALQDPKFARTVVAGCDVVIHLAAAQHEANVPESYFREVNVDATRCVLEASCEAGVRRFVYGSTIGVYGSAQGELDESSSTLPDNMYGRTKLQAEQLVKAYADRIESTIVRISETYGPGDFRLLKLFKAIDRGVFMMIGSGANQRQVIYVDDLARGLLAAAEHPGGAGEVFVLAGIERLTTQQMVRHIADALGRPAPHKRVPIAPFLAAATVLESTLRPLGVQPPLHRRRLDFFTKSFTFATDKAERLLGFHAAISFAAGVRETAEWYRRHGHLGPAATPHGVAASTLPAAPAAASLPADVPLRAVTDEGWQHSELLEYTHDAIIIWEMDGAGIVFWNRAAEQLYGYSRAEAFGKITHELLETRTAGGVGKLEARLAQHGVWLGELQHTAKDGRRIDVHGRLALLSQHSGRWLVLEVNRDITDLNRAVAQQQALEAQLAALKRRAKLE